MKGRTRLCIAALMLVFANIAWAQVEVPAAGATIPPLPSANDAVIGYYWSNLVAWSIGTVIGVVFPALVVFSGLSARIRDLSKRIGRRWIPPLVIYLAIYLILAATVNLPLGWFDDFHIEHAYGLSNQSFDRWLTRYAVSIVIGLVAISIGFGLLYRIIKWSPRRWWLWAAIAWLPVGFFLVMIQPIYIQPLFNRFEPVSDAALRSEIVALADRAGIGDAEIYQIDASTDTERIDATAVGLLNTKRIVFFDTMLDKLDRDEVLFVMGHEIGHYVLDHQVQRMLVGSLLIFIMLWSLYRVTGILMARFGLRFGFSELHDIASVPLLLMCIQGFSLFFAPAYRAFVRHTEHEADRFALEITQDNVACAAVMIAGIEEGLMNPRPGRLYQLFRAGHPSPAARYDFCVSYRPWETGGTLEYSDRFRPIAESTL